MISSSPCARPNHGRRLALAGTLVTLALGAGCARHVVLRVPQTEMASSYECREGACAPATVDIPELANQMGTTHLALPHECGRFISRIVILDAHTSSPVVWVHCATPDRPVEEMSRSP